MQVPRDFLRVPKAGLPGFSGMALLQETGGSSGKIVKGPMGVMSGVPGFSAGFTSGVGEGFISVFMAENSFMMDMEFFGRCRIDA